VKPHLECARIVWDPDLKNMMKLLNMCKKSAKIRFALRTGTSIQETITKPLSVI